MALLLGRSELKKINVFTISNDLYWNDAMVYQ